MNYIKVKDVTEFVRNGASIKQDKQCSNGIPITRIETISNSQFNWDKFGYANITDDKYKDYYLKDKDVLLSHINSVKFLGRSVIFNQKDSNPIIHGMNLLCLRFNQNNYIPDLFVWYSKSQIAKQYIIENTKKAVNQASITSSAIKEMPIPNITLAEQKEIITQLEKIQYAIYNKKQQLALLDEAVKSEFVEMFGDPIQNPMKWDTKKLCDTTEIITGNTPSRKDKENYGSYIEWVKTDNITNDYYVTNASECLSEKGVKLGRTVEAGSILMACIAGSLRSIGRVALTDRKVAFNQQINAIVPKKYNNLFLYALFQNTQSYAQSTVNMELKGILSKGKLEQLKYILPPITLQNNFAAFVQHDVRADCDGGVGWIISKCILKLNKALVGVGRRTIVQNDVDRCGRKRRVLDIQRALVLGIRCVRRIERAVRAAHLPFVRVVLIGIDVKALLDVVERAAGVGHLAARIDPHVVVVARLRERAIREGHVAVGEELPSKGAVLEGDAAGVLPAAIVGCPHREANGLEQRAASGSSKRSILCNVRIV